MEKSTFKKVQGVYEIVFDSYEYFLTKTSKKLELTKIS